MPVFELTLSLKQNGVEVFGTPIRRRLEVDESTGVVEYEKATGGGYAALPTSIMDELNLLVVRTDKAVTLRLDGQSDAGLALQAGGLVIIVDADIDAGATTNVTVDNSSGDTALIKVLAGGT